MKKMKAQIRVFESLLPLIEKLSDHLFHSGEELAQTFGISRMAIHKKMVQLDQFGINVESKKKVGYRIKYPIQRLEKAKITPYLTYAQQQKMQIFPIIDSTNQALLAKLGTIEKGQVYIAEQQIKGRGRQGRTWFSPFGCNLYYSIYWRFEQGFQALSGLSLAIGCVIAQLLTDLTDQSIKVKWPNDLYLNDKKMGGILIELSGKMGDCADVVIGIGLNLNMPKAFDYPIDQPYDSLSYQDRNHLVGQLTTRLHQALAKFEQEGFAAFYPMWQNFDLFLNQPIQFVAQDRLLSGIERGVNQQGALLIEDQTGFIKPYLSGEIQLKKLIVI